MSECGNCGSTEGLQVHHIVPRGLGGTERETNKITLCVDCHAKVHGWTSGYAEAWKRGVARIREENAKKRQLIKSLIEAGKCNREIADEVGISRNGVWYYRKMAGG